MNSDILRLLTEIGNQKGISEQVVLDALEGALTVAYRRHNEADQNVKVKIGETGEIKIFVDKVVTDKTEQLAVNEVCLPDAVLLKPDVSIGDAVECEISLESFGRIAAQTVRQVVMQRIKEAEREKIFNEYSNKANDILVGVVRRVERRNVMLEIDGMESILAPNDQVKNDDYYVGQRLKIYVVEIANYHSGVQLIVSRRHCGLVKKLFELEVPEIQQKLVDIVSIAREPGERTKIAVLSNNSKVDPVGACVGTHGLRVKNVMDELNGEKVDIIKYSEDPFKFVAAAMSPAKVSCVMSSEDGKKYDVIVSSDQLSLAIGKGGQNVRLAAKLTKFKLDVRGE